MGSAFHQLCPRYSGTLTRMPHAAIRLWETLTCVHTILVRTFALKMHIALEA